MGQTASRDADEAPRAQEVPQQLLKSLATLADAEGLELELPARPSLPKLRALLDQLQAAQP